jgi:hypothetical protein
MPRRKSNWHQTNDRVCLAAAQHSAINAIAATMPAPKRYSFLLAVMVALKRGDTDHGAVSDQQVRQAIGHALEQHA